ncbi:MAG: magnesium chelatase subunit D [Roseovarius sp.]
MSAAPEWDRALTALTLLALDPGGLKGATLRARAGPVRQALEGGFTALPLPVRRIHPGLTDTQLFGGLNVAASLAEGRMVRDAGLAETPSALVLPMAERCPSGLSARLGQVLDADTGHALILLDEGAGPEEAAPEGLTERLAFHVDLSETRATQARLRLPAPADLDAARARLAKARPRAEDAETLVALAARFGISSLRAPQLALRAALALAALDGRRSPNDDDLRAAAELVYPARATLFPEEPEPDAEEPEAEEPESTEDKGEDAGESQPDTIPDELLVEAIAALLPPDLLERLQARARRRGAQGSGAGARRIANRRGRPLPPRPGHPDGRARVDIIATLRAAAPWQPLRRAARDAAGTGGTAPKLIIHPADIRLKRYEERSDRLVIFTVDASGSAAMARMAEAKGAVELMLAQAYAKRDQVALVGFRGEGAEILLSPTRSLVQAKRRLAGLPGGGGTPLASGLRAALELSELARVRGLTPTLAVLTDGRANIALDGRPGRGPAREDAQAMARRLGAAGLTAVVIDTAARPGPEGASLAGWMGARYLALPRADAARISAATDAALAD